jgi:hypothetical protein
MAAVHARVVSSLLGKEKGGDSYSGLIANTIERLNERYLRQTDLNG